MCKIRCAGSVGVCECGRAVSRPQSCLAFHTFASLVAGVFLVLLSRRYPVLVRRRDRDQERGCACRSLPHLSWPPSASRSRLSSPSCSCHSHIQRRDTDWPSLSRLVPCQRVVRSCTAPLLDSLPLHITIKAFIFFMFLPDTHVQKVDTGPFRQASYCVVVDMLTFIVIITPYIIFLFLLLIIFMGETQSLSDKPSLALSWTPCKSSSPLSSSSSSSSSYSCSEVTHWSNLLAT